MIKEFPIGIFELMKETSTIRLMDISDPEELVGKKIQLVKSIYPGKYIPDGTIDFVDGSIDRRVERESSETFYLFLRSSRYFLYWGDLIRILSND